MRSPAFKILLAGVVVFLIGCGLRVAAHQLCTHDYHMPGSPGTENNAAYTDVEIYQGLVDIARTLLGLSVALLAVGSTTWLQASNRSPERT